MTKQQIIKRKIREKLRIQIDRNNKKRLQNKDFSLFCSNCTAGIIYHDLGMKFLSPTINMYMEAKDFIRFCGNLEEYTNCELEKIERTELNYPVMKCKDITLFCVHYKDEKEVKMKWKERCKRINWNNIVLMMVERDGCEMDDIIAFDKLPIEKKVIFVHKDMPEIKSAIYIPGTELSDEDGDYVGDMTAYLGKMTGKRNIDKFDYIKFINTGELKLV